MRWKVKNTHRDKRWLNLQYNVKGKTHRQIGKMCGVTEGTVRKWIKKFNLHWHPLKICEICKKEVNELFEITDHCNVTYRSICNVCRDNIKTSLKLRVNRKKKR